MTALPPSRSSPARCGHPRCKAPRPQITEAGRFAAGTHCCERATTRTPELSRAATVSLTRPNASEAEGTDGSSVQVPYLAR
jgi:hypothetical protein